jgi:rhodanese-related sulfurtransferase
LSVQNDGKPVDAVDVETTWESLVSRPGAQLIDVRTRAEWTYVGIPDLGAIGKRAVLVEWQTFPDQTVDPRFVERLAGELKAIGTQLNDDLFFICRSGGRSLAAAKAMAEAGYRPVITSLAVSKGRSTTNDTGPPSEAGRRPVFPGVRASGAYLP